MKVTFATPWHGECGIAHYSQRLVAALREHLEVTVVPLEPPSDRPENGIRSAAYYRERGRELNAGEVAHVQFQYFFFGGVSPLKNQFRAFLREVQVPVVLTVHELEWGMGWQRPVLAWLNRRLLRRPAIRGYIVHTPAYQDPLERLGVPRERVYVLSLPWPEPLPLPEAAEAKERFGLHGRRVVTIFGFIARRKGYELALEALRRLPSDVALLIAGGRNVYDRTDYVEQLRERVAALGLRERVVITGYLSEEGVAAAMAASDLVVAPFTAMSASASLATCLAYGRAVLASDLPPNRALAEEERCLALFRSGDVDDLVAQTEALLADEAARRRLMARAEAGRAAHTFARLAEETRAVYHAAQG